MIYVLLLEKNKWYIGYTDRKDGERFTEHFIGKGSQWTQLYKPIQVMEWRGGTTDDENKVTLEYMQKYGWWNVRGGSYCNINMTVPPKQLIPELPDQMIKLNNQKTKKQVTKNKKKSTECYRCGRSGHLIADCYANTDTNGVILDDIDSFNDSSDDSLGESNGYNTRSNKCFKCGRNGHYASDCYASTHIKGYDI